MAHDDRRRALRKPFLFDRSRLPFGPEQIVAYYASEGVKLSPHGEWRDAICPFHADTKPSLRVRASTGAYRCFVCGAHGAGPLDFHMTRHAMPFIEAAKALGAWIERDRIDPFRRAGDAVRDVLRGDILRGAR